MQGTAEINEVQFFLREITIPENEHESNYSKTHKITRKDFSEKTLEIYAF